MGLGVTGEWLRLGGGGQAPEAAAGMEKPLQSQARTEVWGGRALGKAVQGVENQSCFKLDFSWVCTNRLIVDFSFFRTDTGRSASGL